MIRFALVLAFLASLTGCDGEDGAPGAPGLPAGVDIGSAAEINAAIDRVTIASPAVVEFSLTDAGGTCGAADCTQCGALLLCDECSDQLALDAEGKALFDAILTCTCG